jgi:hypothetical protein
MQPSMTLKPATRWGPSKLGAVVFYVMAMFGMMGLQRGMREKVRFPVSSYGKPRRKEGGIS